ncbi:MAG: exo-alpha-sialidase [Phycisphaerae bacterium]|nr:exo-alpha-sialidase [Phycisphaerae bacterium]
MNPTRMLAILARLILCAAAAAAGAWPDGKPVSYNRNLDTPREPIDVWRTLYDMETGFRHEPPIHSTWLAPLTRSEWTPEGLRIIDPTAQKPSGRVYFLDWDIDPAVGGAAEVVMKTLACSESWGAGLLVSDGVHEEGITFFTNRVELSRQKISAPFDCGSGFHTYRVEFRGTNIAVFADGELLIDGQGRFTHPASGIRNRVGFGSGSNAARGDSVWQRVRYRSGGRVFMPEVQSVMEIPGLKVTLEKSRKLFDHAWPTLLQKRNGDIIMRGNLSSDGGETWTPSPIASTWTAFECRDGTILELGYHSRPGPDGTWITDSHRTLPDGKRAKETTVLRIPAPPNKGDDSETYGPALGHGVLEMDDGSLIATAFGRLEGDDTCVPAFEWEAYKYRTFLVRSTDRGRSWDYVTTIARDPEIGIESFCEPWLLRLPDGDILCFMRTGGYLSAEKYTPIYLSRSSDDGATWSEPAPITDRGVMPRARLLENGVIVLSYGRNGSWLAFSLDMGHTWTGHFCYANNPSYENNHLAVLPGNRILLLHDNTALGRDGNPANETYGTWFTVERTE